MSSRTDRFGFLTFESESDDLSAMDYKAFVADREAMDRLLRVACEAHTHTGEVVSDVPTAPPILNLQTIGGALPPNQPIYYKVSVVDIYGQERIASSAAVVYGPPQIETPNAPTLTADTGGTLMPGDYQYAISAWVNDASSETAISKITTGSLRGQGAWTISPPSPPSGTHGWNLYRKGPTEAGFRRLQSIDAIANNNFRDDGSTARRDQRAPDENTTFLTNAVNVDLQTPLEPGQSTRIYRSFDAGDWDHTLIEWTAEMPYLDIGGATMSGYPPDTNAGVGGAPKIRLGVDTEGHLPGGMVTPMQTAVFNIRGPLQVGFWPWQWINELNTFYLLGMRANLGRDSVPDATTVRVVLERRYAGSDSWYRIVDQNNVSYYAEIPVGQTVGPVTGFLPESLSDLKLGPGDALRIAVAQTGGGARTDRDLTLTVLAGVQHGSTDSSDLLETFDLSFRTPTGATAGSVSDYIDVLNAQTGIASILWDGVLANANGFQIEDMNGTIYPVQPETANGSMSAPTEWPPIVGPTRLRIKTLDAQASLAKITLRLLGDGTDVQSGASWTPTFDYTLLVEPTTFTHWTGAFGDAPRTNKRAVLDVPDHGEVSRVRVNRHGPASGMTMRLRAEVATEPLTLWPGVDIECNTVGDVSFDMPRPWRPNQPNDQIAIDIFELSVGDENPPPVGDPVLSVAVEITNSLSAPPADWPGMTVGVPMTDYPLYSPPGPWPPLHP